MYYCQNTESFLFSFFYFLTIWLFDVRDIDWFIRIINQLDGAKKGCDIQVKLPNNFPHLVPKMYFIFQDL